MPSRSRAIRRSTALALLLATFGLAVAFAAPARAAEVDSSDIVIISEGDVFSEDLYVAANRVLIRGRIEGDLVALAAQDVLIEGEVTGSVMAMAAQVVVTGTIGESLRVTSPDLSVSGTVGSDMIALAADLELTGDSEIGGDVFAWSWAATASGMVGGDFEGTLRNLALSGVVEGDVAVTVAHLDIPGDLVVGRDLNYRSGNPATGLDNATVGGATVQQSPVAPNIRIRALGVAVRIVVAILLSAVALLVSSSFPERTERAVDGVRRSPFRQVLLGLAVLASPLLVLGVAVGLYALAPPAAALPLIAVLTPLLFATLGIVLLLGIVAGVPAAALVGSRLRKNTTIAGAVGLGSLVIAVLWLLPVVGWLVALAAMAVGLGGWLSTLGAGERAEEEPVRVS